MNESSSGRERVDGRTARHQHRRPELLAALTEYLLEHGVADLSLRKAATAIGVSHVTLLRHFATKEDLINEVVEWFKTDLAARVDEELATPTPTDIGALLWDEWVRLTEPRERQQFLLLCELVARHGRDAGHQADLGSAVSYELAAPYRARLVRDFGVHDDEALVIAQLVVAQMRGLIIDLVLSGSRTHVDVAMKQFIALIAPRVQAGAPDV